MDRAQFEVDEHSRVPGKVVSSASKLEASVECRESRQTICRHAANSTPLRQLTQGSQTG